MTPTASGATGGPKLPPVALNAVNPFSGDERSLDAIEFYGHTLALSRERFGGSLTRKDSGRSHPDFQVPAERLNAEYLRRATGHSREADSPQMWLTTMWHAGTGWLWEWRTGPSDSSERGHLLEMLAGLPAAVLIAADAGFVGDEYARAITDSGRPLLVRVGSHVKLLRKLGNAPRCSGTMFRKATIDLTHHGLERWVSAF